MSLRLPYWNHAPEAMKRQQAINAYLDECGLEPELIDLVYLRASQINGCAFCLDMHSRDLRRRGVPQQKLDCIAGWRELSSFTARERAALGWTEALTLIADTRAPDEAWAPVRAEFGDKEIADLTFAITTINAWNRLSVGFRNSPRVAREG